MSDLVVGAVLRIPDPYYKYGAGPLTLRLIAVVGPAATLGWVRIRGARIGWQGRAGNIVEVDVQMSAIAAGLVKVSPQESGRQART